MADIPQALRRAAVDPEAAASGGPVTVLSSRDTVVTSRHLAIILALSV